MLMWWLHSTPCEFISQIVFKHSRLWISEITVLFPSQKVQLFLGTSRSSLVAQKTNCLFSPSLGVHGGLELPQCSVVGQVFVPGKQRSEKYLLYMLWRNRPQAQTPISLLYMSVLVSAWLGEVKIKGLCSTFKSTGSLDKRYTTGDERGRHWEKAGGGNWSQRWPWE